MGEVDVSYLTQLEMRQEDILRRLELLKAEVSDLAKEQGASVEKNQVTSMALGRAGSMPYFLSQYPVA